MNLSKTDEKILAYLYDNCRDSYSKIAKECNLTRTQVEYNIKKYIEKGLIRNFITIFNYNKLGFQQPVILLVKLKKEFMKEEFMKLVPRNNTVGIGETLNKYDFYITLLFKNTFEKQKILSKILFNDYIENHNLLEPFETELYPLKFLDQKYKISSSNLIESEKENIKLDKEEIQILNILKKNAREKIVNIAKQVNISSELVLYKVRKLKEEGIIIGTRIAFNMDLLGYFYTIVLIDIKNLSNENLKKIKKFARSNPYINSFGIINGNPSLYLQVFHREEKDIRKVIEMIKKEFEEEEINIDLLYLKEEIEEVNTLPYLQ